MKKLLSILCMLFVVVILLLGAAVAFSPFFLNKYKDQILARAGEAVNRSIRLGDIRLTIFTGLGVRLKDVSVSNAPGFRSEPMLTMESLDVKIKLLPLLAKQLQADRIIFQTPTILIEKNKAGLYNFDDLIGAQQASGSADAAEKQEPHAPASADDLLAGFFVSQLEISDGVIRYYDAQTAYLEKGLHIQELDFSVQELSLERPMPFSLRFSIDHYADDLQLTGTLGPVGTEITVDIVPLDVRVMIPKLALKPLMGFVEEPVYIIEDGALTINTNISGDPTAGLTIAGDVAIHKLTLRDPEDNTIFTQGFSLDSTNNISVSLTRQKIVINNIDLAVNRARVTLSGNVDTFMDEPSFSISYSSTAIPLQGWDRILPMLEGITMDGSIKALGSVSGSFETKITAVCDISSPNFIMQLEDDQIASLQEDQGLTDVLAADALAADRGAALPPTSKPLLPENLFVKGAVTIDKGLVNQVPFSELKTDYTTVGNRVTVTNFSVKGFGKNGFAVGTFSADLASDPLAYRGQLKATRIDLAAVQKLVAPTQGLVEGECKTAFRFSGAGFELEDLEKHLKGRGNFKVNNGLINNVNLKEEILSVLAAKYGIPLAALSQMAGIDIIESEQTSFEEFYGVFKVADGSILVQDSTITSQDHGFSASGTVGFNQQMDMRARMILKKVTDAPKKKITYYLIDEKNRKYIPFRLRGSVAKPEVMVDVKALIKGQAGQVLEGEKKKLKEKLGPAGEEILKPLEDIFKF